jgi:hypothetical protein
MHINFCDIWNSNTILFRWFKVGRLNWRTSRRGSLHGVWRGRRRPGKPTVPVWRARRAVAWGATTLSIRATRAGATKRVRCANNVFEVLFLKIILKKVKIKKSSHPWKTDHPTSWSDAFFGPGYEDVTAQHRRSLRMCIVLQKQYGRCAQTMKTEAGYSFISRRSIQWRVDAVKPVNSPWDVMACVCQKIFCY